MNKLYADKDLYDLGKALHSCTQENRYIPNELGFKTTFLLLHPDLNGLSEQQQDLLYEFDRFMNKYHPANHHTYKLVRSLCKSAIKTYLFKEYNHRAAQEQFSAFTHTLPYNVTTQSGLVILIKND